MESYIRKIIYKELGLQEGSWLVILKEIKQLKKRIVYLEDRLEEYKEDK